MLILVGVTTATAAVTCGDPVDRDLHVQEIPLGDRATGGRLATIATLDIDGDGRSEMVGAVVPPLEATSPMGLWSASLPRGSRSATPRLSTLGGLSFAGLHVLPGDLDGDGDLDVVLADPARDELTRVVWLADGAAVEPTHSADIGPEPIVADLGPDGTDELLSVSPIGSAAVWSLGAESPTKVATGTVRGGVEQTVGDLDGDGSPEWIISRGGSRRLTVAWGGDLNAQREYRVKVKQPRGPLAVDLDQDGQAEVLVADRRRAAVRMLRSDALKPGPWIVRLRGDAARDTPQTLLTADADGDGCTDVLFHSFATQELAIAWGGNRGRFHTQRWTLGEGPVAVGDLDGRAGDEVAVVAGERVLVMSATPQ
ncbi:MAG: VCBS repeat-containing protein [Myxococcales bacterium]|nr:VCBS repeat-containing protein [Myxococcales bacterium]